MALQTIHRGLRKMVMAPWQATGSYGTSLPVRGARNMGVALVVESDQLIGDDVVLDRNTKIIAADVNWEIATLDLELLDAIVGGALIMTADYYDWQVGEDDEVPYVGIAGRVVGSSAQGDLHIFIPKAKLSGNLSIQAQQGAYLLPNGTFQGVDDDGLIADLRNFTAATALEIPLRTTTGGF